MFMIEENVKFKKDIFLNEIIKIKVVIIKLM